MKNTDLVKLLQKFPPSMDVSLLDLRQAGNPPGGIYPAITVAQIGPCRKAGREWLAIEINDPMLPVSEAPELPAWRRLALGLQLLDTVKPEGQQIHLHTTTGQMFCTVCAGHGSTRWTTSEDHITALLRLGWRMMQGGDWAFVIDM